jgi:hypothetical protein
MTRVCHEKFLAGASGVIGQRLIPRLVQARSRRADALAQQNASC